MTAMVACGEKDNKNDNNNPTPQQTDYIPGGLYIYSVDEEGTDSHLLWLLDDETLFQYTVSHGEGNIMSYYGDYQYSNATHKGSVDLYTDWDEYGHPQGYAGKAEFTYNGAITVTFLDETVTLAKRPEAGRNTAIDGTTRHRRSAGKESALLSFSIINVSGRPRARRGGCC